MYLLAWMGAAVFLAVTAAPLLGLYTATATAWLCGGLGFYLTALFLLSSPEGRVRRLLPKTALLLFCVSLALGCYAARWEEEIGPFQVLDGTTALARVEFLDYPEIRYGRFYYPVRVLELDGRAVKPFRVRLSCGAAANCRPCDQGLSRLTFYAFSGGGIYSVQDSQAADGCALGAYETDYGGMEVLPRSSALFRLLPELRRYAARSLSRCMPEEEAALVQTVLLGQRSHLPSSVSRDLRQLGCSHLLAISGLHMSLIGLFLYALASRLPVGRRLRCGLCCALLFAYLVLIGFPVPAVRSFLMFSFSLLGEVLGRRAEGLNALGLAVLILCLTRPLSGGDMGFALSVLATAGILLLSRPMQEKLAPLLPGSGPLHALARRISGSFCTTLSALLFTLPLQLAVFRGLPLLLFLSNLLLLPVFTLLLFLAVPLLILALFSPALAQPLALACTLLARLAAGLGRWLAQVPGGFLDLTHPVWLLACALGVLALLFLVLQNGRPSFLSSVSILLCLELAFLLPTVQSLRTRDAVTIAVSGDSESACVVLIKNGRAAVVSMGASGRVEEILSRRNVRQLESVLICEQTYSARRMARELWEEYQPQRIYLYNRTYTGEPLPVPGRYLPENGAFTALPGLRVQVLSGRGVLRFQANGRRVLLALNDCAPGSCDLLITNQNLPQIQAALTLLLQDEGTSPLAAALLAHSDFFLTDDQNILYLDLFPDGSIDASWY